MTITWLLPINHLSAQTVTEKETQTESAAESQAEPTTQTDSKTDSKTDWPVFRGNAESTGVTMSKLPEELEIVWEFKVPQGAFEGSPVIVSEKSDPKKQTVYIADLDGKLFALALEDGKPRWEFKSEIGFLTAPAVKDGRIYIGDLDGVFYCIDETGEKVWSHQTEGEINSSANFFENTVIVGSQDSNLYAFDLTTGEVKWKFESADQIRCSATIAGDRAFVAGCDGFFHIIDLNDGTEIGKTDIGGPTGSTPAVLGDRVFFGSEQGDFLAVDWQKIENDWRHTEPQSGNSVRGSAAVTKEHVIFGGRNRIVYSLKPETGEINWSVTLKGKIDSSPVIVGDRVFVASSDGRVVALTLADGKIDWEKQFNGGIISSPAVAFERIVIATDRGVVYCLGSK